MVRRFVVFSKVKRWLCGKGCALDVAICVYKLRIQPGFRNLVELRGMFGLAKVLVLPLSLSLGDQSVAMSQVELVYVVMFLSYQGTYLLWWRAQLLRALAVRQEITVVAREVFLEGYEFLFCLPFRGG